MGLSSFVYNAKKNTPQTQKFDPNKKLTNFIDATDNRAIKSEDSVAADGNGEIAAFQTKKFNWEECPDLKKTLSRPLCRKFFSHCAKEKCKSAFPSSQR